MERASEGNSGSEFLWIEHIADGKSADRKFHPIANKEAVLPLERTGNEFTFSIRQEADAKTWTEIHTEEAELPNDLQVGVLAINTTTSCSRRNCTAAQVPAQELGRQEEGGESSIEAAAEMLVAVRFVTRKTSSLLSFSCIPNFLAS